uniref:Glycoside hydrolase family 3 n=2 Tax=gut metagenome TaxID=749906 RepID=A0ABF7PQ34_9ZZZZ
MQTLPYLDPTLPIERRIDDALARMTTAEKIALIHAQSKFSSPGVKRLGIPELWMTDGPHGIRPEVLWDEWEQAGWTNDSCVAFPALTALAATWNSALSQAYGKALGEEARWRNKSVVLGPGVNIARTPLNGRNFEYMGEDPYLAARMVVPYIYGVQSNGVATSLKHFALNNHELNRHTTNVRVSDRALREIYLPAFEAAVREGKTWTVMGAYNLYRDQHLCHNQYLLNDVLKREWNYDGVVVSDWGGTHNTDEAVRHGLDLEFGTWTNGLYAGASNAYDSYYLARPYADAIAAGRYGTDELDDKVRRVLRLTYRTEMRTDRPRGAMCSEEHYAVARAVGNEAIVLLKNDKNILPLPADARNLLVVGENAIKMMTVGGGSSSLKAQREVLPLDGLRARFGADRVRFERGYVGDVTGEYNGVVTGQDLRDDRSPERLMADAVAAARQADYVLFVGGLNKSAGQDCEDSDRAGLALPYGQDALIAALAKANPRTIVLNISGNPVAMPWKNDVAAILQVWMLGSEAGHSMADVISGDANPSGKLPFTSYAALDQCGAHALGAYPGQKRADSEIWDVDYKEDIFVGYRWVDRQRLQPNFPFGHGLSYTTFAYGRLQLPQAKSVAVPTASAPLRVSVPIANTGTRAGQEVVQVYVRELRPKVDRPERELKAFRKVMLQPGERQILTFDLDETAFRYYDDKQQQWVVNAGEFEIQIGSSSRDIRTKAKIRLQ